MKYYLYISDSKVDNLFQGLPLEKRKIIESEISANIAVLKATRKEKRNAYEDSIDRLNVIVRHLSAANKIGTIDEPASWIKAECEVFIKQEESNKNTIFFLGETKYTCFALGGSSHHLIGDSKNPDTYESMSFSPRLVKVLENHLDNPLIFSNSDSLIEKAMSARVSQGKRAWAQQIDAMLKSENSDSYFVGFIAKKLLIATYAERTYILATPLYVAMIN